MIMQQPYIARKMALFSDRDQAQQYLARALEAYKNSDAVVVAVPRGGVPVANHIAQELQLPMEVFPCEKIAHPADRSRSIGSVCLNEVVIHDSDRDIPQEYIQYAVQRLRTALRERQRQYAQGDRSINLAGKTAIIVDDWLTTGDTILACLRDIQRQGPERIVVAAPIVTPQALKSVSKEADDVVFVLLDDNMRPSSHRYFSPVDEEEVLRILRRQGLRPGKSGSFVTSTGSTTTRNV